jgi:hypothetical protein
MAVRALYLLPETKLMPTVAIVAGVRIIFYWNDHSPPHFHVEFAEHRGQVTIESLELMEGSLPAAKLAAVRLWASSRQEDLLECWNKARNNEHPGKVE